MRRSIITQSLSFYFYNYFNFKGYTDRKHYWWALGLIYVISMILGTTTGLAGIPWVMAIWLIINIIPLLSLTARRLRDVGLTNKGILTIAGLIILTAGLVVYIKSSAAAFVLQLLVLAVVLIPILRTDELTSTHASSFLNFFVRPTNPTNK